MMLIRSTVNVPIRRSPSEVPVYSMMALTKREPNGAQPMAAKVKRLMIRPRYSLGDPICNAVLLLTVKSIMIKPSIAKRVIARI